MSYMKLKYQSVNLKYIRQKYKIRMQTTKMKGYILYMLDRVKIIYKELLQIQ